MVINRMISILFRIINDTTDHSTGYSSCKTTKDIILSHYSLHLGTYYTIIVHTDLHIFDIGRQRDK